MQRETLFKMIYSNFKKMTFPTSNPKDSILYLDLFDHADLQDYKDKLDEIEDWLSVARLFEMSGTIRRCANWGMSNTSFDEIIITCADYFVAALYYVRAKKIRYAQQMLSSQLELAQQELERIEESLCCSLQWKQTLWTEISGDLYILIDPDHSLINYNNAFSKSEIYAEHAQEEIGEFYLEYYNGFIRDALNVLLKTDFWLSSTFSERKTIKLNMREQLIKWMNTMNNSQL